MIPDQLIAIADALNRARDCMSPDDGMYPRLTERLDDVCVMIATWADDADTEYGDLFRDHCRIGY